MEDGEPNQLDNYDRTGREPETITKTTARPGKAAADTKDQAGPRATQAEFCGLFGRPKPSDTTRAKSRSQAKRE